MNKEDFTELLQISLLLFDGVDLSNYAADPELMEMAKKLVDQYKKSNFSTTYRITPNDLKKIGRFV